MQLLENVADELALKALKITGDADDNTLIDLVSEAIGSSSATLQESFLTAVRVRRAETRAETVMKEFASKG